MPQWTVDFNCRLDTQDEQVREMLTTIEALSRVIRGIPLPPSVKDRIDSLNIMRAVRGTTGIEGTEVSETEVEQIIASPPAKQVLPDSRKRAEQEVRNANNVMRYVASLLRDEPRHPITEDLIREIHRRTTKGIDYLNNEPGLYRNHAVNVGTYVPPRDPAEVRRLMAEFVRVFNEGPPQGWPPASSVPRQHSPSSLP